ncbi:MAG TPA: hypothetical protein VGN23_10700 [Verrucomicrobiae bacterium]|jgi:tellurite resistance protein TehA-like permease
MNLTVFGLIFLAISLTGLWCALRHFEWMQKNIPFLLYWGRWPWRFPATKVGVSAGCITGMTIGALCLDPKFEFLSRTIWIGILIMVAVMVIAAAIYDYILYRKHKIRFERMGRKD